MPRLRRTRPKRRDPSRVPVIEGAIRTIREERVIIDADLAKIYGVETKALNRAIKRNLDKFPSDFLFQLTLAEQESLRCQFGTSNPGRGGRRYMPYAFTEHGAIMAANILSSPQAVQMSVFEVRAFLRMRSTLAGTHDLARKLALLESELTTRLDTHEAAIVDVLRRILQLLEPPSPPPAPPEREMGHHTGLKFAQKS